MQTRAAVLVLILLATGCSGASGVIEITDSWAPTTPPNAQAAVIYLTIDNGTGTDDRLVDVATDRCNTVELHATQIDEQRIMRMRLAEPELLQIPAGKRLEMVPGGLHVMCIGPTSPFQDGDAIALQVTLAEAGTIAVTAEVENR